MTVTVPLSLLIDEVCRVSRIPRARLVSRSRKRALVRLRQAISFVIRRKTTQAGKPVSYPMIGQSLGGHDHSTVMHNCTQMLNLLTYKEPQALRAYKIAIRSYVKLAQQEAERRQAIQQAVARVDAARAAQEARAERELDLLAA